MTPRPVGCAVLACVLILTARTTSAQAQAPATVTFHNNTSGPIRLFWLNPQTNQEQLFQTLEPGAKGDQETFTHHVWVLRDAFGNRLQRVTVGPNTRIVRPPAAPGTRPGPAPHPEQPQPTTVTFRNNAQGPVGVFWLNPQTNQERRYETLGPGATAEQKTFTTHVWIVRDADGNALHKVTIAPDTREILAQTAVPPRNPNNPPNNPDPNPNPTPTPATSGILALTEQAKAAVTYLNQVRANPTAFSSDQPKGPGEDDFGRIYVNLTHAPQRPALAWNDVLATVADAKARELAAESVKQGAIVIKHVSSNGEGINIRMLRAGYEMPADWGTPLDRNNFECLGSKWDRSDTPPNLGRGIINQLINDGGNPDNQAGHRNAMLGYDQWNANMVDVGVGLVRFPAPGNNGYFYIMSLVLGKHQF